MPATFKVGDRVIYKDTPTGHEKPAGVWEVTVVQPHTGATLEEPTWTYNLKQGDETKHTVAENHLSFPTVARSQGKNNWIFIAVLIVTFIMSKK